MIRSAPSCPGGHMGFVGVNYDVKIHGPQLFLSGAPRSLIVERDGAAAEETGARRRVGPWCRVLAR
jgi:hypothetical protein